MPLGRRALLGRSFALLTSLLGKTAIGQSQSSPQDAGGGVGHNSARAPLLRPGPGWRGTANSGGIAPEQSDIPFGQLVQDERFTGGFSAIPGQWIHREGTLITALGLPPQDAQSETVNPFREAEFFLEGNRVTVTGWSVNETPVTMADGSIAPQGSIGFSIEIGGGVGAVRSGDALLYCYLRGEHGLERRIVLPLTIDTDGQLANSRRTAHVDPQNGSDAADGSADRPWKSLQKALGRDGVGDGGLVILAKAGRYLVDDPQPAPPALMNRRMIEVRTAPSLTPEQVIITRTNRLLPEPRWVVRANRVHFIGVTIDLGKVLTLQGSFRDYILAFSGCRLIDPAGPNGPIDSQGYDIGYNVSVGPNAQREGATSVFANANGRVFLTECLLETYCTAGAHLYRNVTARMSTDSLSGGPGYDDVVVDGYSVEMTRSFRQRLHVDHDLVVESASRHSSGMTEVVLAPTAGAVATMGRRPDCQVQIVSGALAGRAEILAVSLAQAPGRLFLAADVATQLRPGDRLRYYITWHSDFLQQAGVNRPSDRGIRNLTIFRYRASSPTAQLMLTQGQVPLNPGTTISCDGTRFRLSGDKPNILLPDDVLRLQSGPQAGQARLVASFDPATQTGALLDPFTAPQQAVPVNRGKTITGLALALSRLEKTGTAAEQGQFQEGHRNIVATQCAFYSQPLCVTFRNRNPGHGNRNHVHLHNIYSRLDADTPDLPTDGLRVTRCQFETGKVRGKGGRLGAINPPRGGAIRRPSRRPDILSFGIDPLVPFDMNGAPLSAASPIGPGGD